VQSIKRRLARGIFGNPFGADPLMATQAALYVAEKNYVPKPINTPITLFNSRIPWGVVEDDTLGWSEFCKDEIRIHKFDFYNDTLLEDPDSVRITAKVLREILDEKMSWE